MRKAVVQYKRSGVRGIAVRELMDNKTSLVTYRKYIADRVNIYRDGDEVAADIHHDGEITKLVGVDVIDVMVTGNRRIKIMHGAVERVETMELLPSYYDHGVEPYEEGLDVEIQKINRGRDSIVRLIVWDRYYKRRVLKKTLHKKIQKEGGRSVRK